MKKIIFNIMFIAVITGIILVGCDKEETAIHHYTPEELAEIARQDSLKQIIPVDYVFTQNVVLPYSDGWVPVTMPLVQDKDTAKLLELMGYNTVKELLAGLGTLTGNPPTLAQEGNDITYYAYNWSTKYENLAPSTTNSFGHWIDMNSDVTTWGNGQLAYCEKKDTFSLDYNFGHLPGDAKVGDVFHFVEAMKYDTTSVAFIFNVTIVAELPIPYPEATVVGTANLTLTTTADTLYTASSLALDTVAITNAIGCKPEAAVLYGVNMTTDSLYLKGFTANNGCWFNASGDVVNWGADACAIGAEYAVAGQVINVFQFPYGAVAGNIYKAKLAFINDQKRYNVIITVTIQ